MSSHQSLEWIDNNEHIYSVLVDGENHWRRQPLHQTVTTLVPSNRTLLCFSAALSAGATCATYNSLDCLRVRWQVMKPLPSERLLHYGIKVARTEGFIEGLWKPGLACNVAGMSLSAAIRFGWYESVRDTISRSSSNRYHDPGSSLLESEKRLSHMLLAGFSTGFVGYVATAPFHLVKTFIQAEKGLEVVGRSKISPFFGTLISLAKKNGIPSLWNGCIPLGARGALFTSGQMLGYDGFKTFAKDYLNLSDSPRLHIISSISAAFGASVLSAPADMVMAKYMSNQGKSGINTLQCMSLIYKEGGIHGFWRGWAVSFIRLCPVMLTFSTGYEQLRNGLGLGYFT
mmetsp:Transcript_36646/g.42586  ORF Transcript_36646/g.42586 Transcript_36646/m.42586 type:complete len:343 (+) Transcript_36646:163-1191(+)